MNYIELLEQIMIEKKLSQQKIAEILEVNQTTVSQWLLGRKKPGYDNIRSICKNFEVSPNEFFEWE
ncbi:MAG: helix-turn-helix transcriptional regulator [Bacillota bacterium]